MARVAGATGVELEIKLPTRRRPVVAACSRAPGVGTLHIAFVLRSPCTAITNNKGSWGFSSPNPAGGSIPNQMSCWVFSALTSQWCFPGLCLFIGHLTEMDFRGPVVID